MKVETNCFYLILIVGVYFIKKVLSFDDFYRLNLSLFQTFGLLIKVVRWKNLLS